MKNFAREKTLLILNINRKEYVWITGEYGWPASSDDERVWMTRVYERLEKILVFPHRVVSGHRWNPAATGICRFLQFIIHSASCGVQETTIRPVLYFWTFFWDSDKWTRFLSNKNLVWPPNTIAFARGTEHISFREENYCVSEICTTIVSTWSDWVIANIFVNQTSN